MKKLSQFLFIILGALFFLYFSSSSVFAQAESSSSANEIIQNQNLQEAQGAQIQNPQQLPLNTEPDVPQNLSTYTQSVFIEILGAGSCFMAGFNPLSIDGRCLGVNPVTKKLGYAEPDGGLIAVAGDMIGATYNIPLSSTHYGGYLAENFGISQNAYAQGVGFAGLKPILKLWEVFRDITYFLFLIVFIVLGLGIMFRLNLDARSVMTIQNQLPRIIVALVLITLSYAIVGFLVDTMYVLMYLIINIFDSRALATIPSIDTNPINAVGGLGGINAITEPVATGAGNALGGIFDGNLGGGLGNFLTKALGGIIGGSAGAGIGKLLGGIGGLVLGGVAAFLALPTGGASLALIPAIMAVSAGVGSGALAGSTIGSLVGGAAGGAIGVATAGSFIKLVAFLIAYLVILIAVLSALFRTWIMLIKAFIMVLVGTIFAPFWILAGILPGVGGGIGSWLRMIIANLAAFPTVLLLFLIGKSIQEQAFSSPQEILIPPFVGELGDNPASGFASIIGLGVVLIMPEALNIVKSALKAPDTGGLIGGMGKSLGVGSGVVGGAFGGIRKSLWYTNPHTGESGRLKAWSGEKFTERMEKIPTLNKLRDKFSTPEARKKRREKSEERKAILLAEAERNNPKPEEPGDDEGGSSTPPSGGTPPPSGGSPTGGGSRLSRFQRVLSTPLPQLIKNRKGSALGSGIASGNPSTGGPATPPTTGGPAPSAFTEEEITNEVEIIKNDRGLTNMSDEERTNIRLEAINNLRERTSSS